MATIPFVEETITINDVSYTITDAYQALMIKSMQSLTNAINLLAQRTR